MSSEEHILRYYDKKNNRLVHIENSSTPHYWDSLWKKKRTNIDKMYYRELKYGFVAPITRKFLKRGSKIIEGGCGLGAKVYALDYAGFVTIGVDYAKDTIRFVKMRYPNLQLIIADVRKLPFKDESFDGYWSLGVIEHFYDGFNEIVHEIYRVLKKDGYLFITFPYMSPLRKIKSKLGLYPTWTEDVNLVSRFSYYILDEREVVSKFEEKEFRLIWKRPKPHSGFIGLKDELWKHNPLQIIGKYDNFLSKGIKYIINKLLSNFCGHAILMVFKKL